MKKIAAVNASSQQKLSNHIRNLTPTGLRRGKENLFIGLSIQPDSSKGFDLPPDDDLFGAVVPLPRSNDGSGAVEAENPKPEDEISAVETPDVPALRFDDD